MFDLILDFIYSIWQWRSGNYRTGCLIWLGFVILAFICALAYLAQI
ncbi:hypothetical protein LLG95_15015 [bacterium]|nr:hypothetical protein [bacterium]